MKGFSTVAHLPTGLLSLTAVGYSGPEQNDAYSCPQSKEAQSYNHSVILAEFHALGEAAARVEAAAAASQPVSVPIATTSQPSLMRGLAKSISLQKTSVITP